MERKVPTIFMQLNSVVFQQQELYRMLPWKHSQKKVSLKTRIEGAIKRKRQYKTSNISTYYAFRKHTVTCYYIHIL
jgi:ABC-type taurine transport system ATPase subunit